MAIDPWLHRLLIEAVSLSCIEGNFAESSFADLFSTAPDRNCQSGQSASQAGQLCRDIADDLPETIPAVALPVLFLIDP
jgi:hypothetical protein